MATRMYVCESSEHSSILLSGLNEQRLKGLLCDVTVRVQGHLFKAHINVLSSAMGYFRDLFFKAGKEKTDHIIDIPMIVNSTGFAKILDFVYTSQLCLSQSTVMQVLCSACYLQIPYVVEKCQEFLSTHGHVTSQASLSEVAVPLLQNLQHNSFSKTTLVNNQKSNDNNLSLLSQLKRMSERPTYLKSRQLLNGSPKHLSETEEQKNSTSLANASSPEMVVSSIANGDDYIAGNSEQDKVEDSSRSCSMISLQLKEVKTPPNDDTAKTPSYSPLQYQRHDCLDNSKSQIQPLPSSSQPLDLAKTADTNRNGIENKSLASVFPGDYRKQQLAQSAIGKSSSMISHGSYRFPSLNGFASTTSHITLTSSKSWKNHRYASSNPTFSFKKEKPKKEFRCEYCHKVFGRQQHLKRHILTHTGERPFPCTYCDKRFRRSEHLKHHLTSHEAASGAETSTVSRKKQKKPVRCENTISESDGAGKSYAATLSTSINGTFVSAPVVHSLSQFDATSAPVVLPSMLIEPERENQSSNEQSRLQYDGSMFEKNATRDLPLDFSTEHETNSRDRLVASTALNLSTANPEETISPLQANMLSREKDNAREDFESSEGLNFNGDMGQNFPGSPPHLSPVDSALDTLDETHAEPDMMKVDGSEVLTSDLKRLIAAFNQ